MKTQNVVFFIGAGFSAPFGIPVMSNFIDKAKDLYFNDIEQYSEIGKTLELIERYSIVKNYMNIDLNNIEDLLSITYMESLIKKNTVLMNHVKNFIKIVIEAYTGEVKQGINLFAELISNLAIKNDICVYSKVIDGKLEEIPQLSPNGMIQKCSKYGVVSLNYDLLIENALDRLTKLNGRFYIESGKDNVFEKYYKINKDLDHDGIPMAKLHGTINGYIVPPTWNKNINNYIQNDWKLAINLLKDATHIVFLGYSLPASDNYIKFLLASSLNNNRRLKRISIITLDSDGETKIRYKNLFDKRMTFHDRNINDFLEVLSINKNVVDFDLFDEYFIKYKNK